MDNIKLYEVNAEYINFLVPYAPHLFQNKKNNQKNERKYIGVVFQIEGFEYFAPLSSFKEKHGRMKETLDFIKVKDYAVINLNNMFPVPPEQKKYVDISAEPNKYYKTLLLAEYRYIKSIQDKIRKNAESIYKIKSKGEKSSLTNRCNDFKLLEKACCHFVAKQSAAAQQEKKTVKNVPNIYRGRSR